MKQKTILKLFFVLGLDGTTVKGSAFNKLCLTREL